MIGVFVQTNTDSRKAKGSPIGYLIQESGCWEWTGQKSKKGYGQVWDAKKKRPERAHRWVYEREHGPIPDGKECHHTCANKACVNPAHIQIVTPKEHFDRDFEKRAGSRVLQRTKSCPCSYAIQGEWRYCRKCAEEYGLV